MHSYRGFLLMLVSGIVLLASIVSVPRSTFAQQNQRLVESVDITGNRRLRKDDILYYVQTRPGDPYNEQQVQRDLQAILALGFFDKTKTRVLTEEGARGGINVIFEVT
jgi:outer membrane protein assembly factor BamA